MGLLMWTVENRKRYGRSKLRYPSDLTDAEWALVEPLIPPAKRGGNKRTVDVREVVNGIMYVLGTGCQWAALPTDLPPRSTVNDDVLRWQHDRTLMRLHHALYVQCANGPDGTQAPRWASSTARASRARRLHSPPGGEHTGRFRSVRHAARSPRCRARRPHRRAPS